MLLTEQYCAYREMFEKTLMEQGTNPYSGIEIGSVIALKWAVRHGMGIAIVPAIESRPPPPETILREVQHLDLGLSVGLIRRADDAPGRARMRCWRCCGASWAEMWYHQPVRSQYLRMKSLC